MLLLQTGEFLSSFEQLTLNSSSYIDQVFFLNAKCHMSLELTNRDPTHRITLNIQIWLARVLSGVREVQVMLDIVHADQNNVLVWTWTTRPLLSIYLKALCLSVLSITGHYGQVRRDSITNISPSQSEAPIVTHVTNQKPPIVPGVRSNTLPDCWMSPDN